MQFRLGTLLCVVTLVAVFCGLVFAAPLIVTAIVLCATMWLSPAVWISGASYASGGKQAFFRGGLICGILPFVAISSYGTMAMFQLFDGDWSQLTSSETELIVRLTLAGLWLTPGLFAFLGGTVGYVTYRLVTPKQESLPPAPALDYRVVSGRLTTQETDVPR